MDTRLNLNMALYGRIPVSHRFLQQNLDINVRHAVMFRQDLEVVDPRDVKRAARLFHRDGFVTVKDALTAEQTRKINKACMVS